MDVLLLLVAALWRIIWLTGLSALLGLAIFGFCFSIGWFLKYLLGHDDSDFCARHRP